MLPATLLLLLSLLRAASGDASIVIGVLEAEPELQLQAVAAVRVALREAAEAAQAAGDDESDASVRSGSAEPRAPHTLPHQLCQLAEEGASVVISGAVGAGAAAVRAAAARAGVPLLSTRDPAPAPGVLPFAPHPDQIAEAASDLIEAKEWKSAVLLAERELGGAARLSRAGGLAAGELASSGAAGGLAAIGTPAGGGLAARALPDAPAMLRHLLLLLKAAGERRVVLWARAARTASALDAAQRAGMLDRRREYLLLDPDAHTASLAPYSYAGANITALRLFDPESKMARSVLELWQAEYINELENAAADADAAREAGREAARVARAPPTALLVAADAARAAVAALARLQLPAMPAADCGLGSVAFHADTLINYLRSEEWPGASGMVRWDGVGARLAERLQVTELAAGGHLTPVGRWLPGALQWTRPPEPQREHPPGFMRNRTFTVLIAKNNPYVMRRESTKRLSGNEQYEGFCIELIELLAQQLGFNYTFVEQEDGNYGSYNNVTRQWTGMMRRLMDDPDIDFAITDLTITAEREQAVDFTTPFMNLGIGILFSTPLPPEPKMFAFLLPFSNGVWVCLGLAYVGTSLVLWLVGRLCPDEWQNPHPCVLEPPALHNQFTLGNALWFNLGAVLLQGSEIAPVAYGTRAVASVWWVFALVITSSYTANLATLLAKKSPSDLITGVEDLCNNTYGITYGAKAGGATLAFFEQSTNPMFQEMYKEMMKRPLPISNQEGIDKVSNRTNMYAFFMESTTIEYAIERNCNVTMVGDLLDNKGYGIAMKKNSSFRQAMNLALLNLQEAGALRDMQRAWWRERHGGGACREDEEHGSEKLSMFNFRGLWLVLCVGCALGVLGSCLDLAIAARRARRPGEPFLHRFASELRFVFQFHRSVKPVRGPLTESSEASSERGSGGSHGAERAGSEGEGKECGEGEGKEGGQGEGKEGGEGDEGSGPRTAEVLASRRASRRSSLAAAELRRRRASRRSHASIRS